MESVPDAMWGLEARNESRAKFQTSETYGEVGNEANLHRKKGKSVERELGSAFLAPEAAMTMRGQSSASLEPPVQCEWQTDAEPAKRQGRELGHRQCRQENASGDSGLLGCMSDLACRGQRLKKHPC